MRSISSGMLRRAWLGFLAIGCLLACQPAPAVAAKPTPTFADISYGPHPDQLLDIYVPPVGHAPFPVLIWYGGIWKPAKNAPDVNHLFPHGCAVIAVETRTMSEPRPTDGTPPIAVVMADACRAVQFVRLNAAKWKLDPNRIAVGGGSQGSLPALYVACSREHANPDAKDPVERMPTKVVCTAPYRSQPSIDPKRMQEWVPGVKWGAPALGYTFEESLKRRDELLPAINRWSPDALLKEGTPPIYFEYNWGLTRPQNVKEMDYLVHSPAWAIGFQQVARQHGVACYVKYPGHPTEKYNDIWDFIVQELTAPNP